jgi:penicillin-binding protein 2
VNNRASVRLFVLRSLVLALLLTLGGRLWYLQVMAGGHYAAAAADTNTRQIVTPAARGKILDDAGRPLVVNRTALVVSVDRIKLEQQQDGGAAVLHRLAGVLKVPYQQLKDKITLCGKNAPKGCWNGSPYQPIPVSSTADTAMALQIMEQKEDYPGVSAELEAVREYPKVGGVNAAQELGYLGPITQAEIDKQHLKNQVQTATEQVGRSGLEQEYQSDLRGTPGIRTVAVNRYGGVTGVISDKPPTPGLNLVTSLDAGVQKAVEDALTHAVQHARTLTDTNGVPYKADSAVGIVMDVKTGRVIAMASYPTYDPSIWVNGISTADYQALTSEANGAPLLSRAIQGRYAPGSTFKIVSTSAAVAAGYPLNGTYPCPSQYMIGNRAFKNFEGEVIGGAAGITLRTALIKSCDTVFYKLAYEQWLKDGGTHPKPGQAKEVFVNEAKAFGLGEKTGVDLPDESIGTIASREFKKEQWAALKNYNCAHAKTGYPDLAKTDPAQAQYLTQLAQENCVDGYLYRGGDAANFAIGQGDTLVTPLQLVRAYAALANGGTIFQPLLGKALVTADGHVVQTLTPKVEGHLPVPANVQAYIRDALTGVPVSGTGQQAFAGFPLAQIPVAGKTGTAEVANKQDTAWFCSFAPANNPQYAVLVMVTQAGQGGVVAAPAVREIYDAIFGVGEPSVLPGGAPPTALPVVRPDGTVAPPPGFAGPSMLPTDPQMPGVLPLAGAPPSSGTPPGGGP